jgi:hypothetical protein
MQTGRESVASGGGDTRQDRDEVEFLKGWSMLSPFERTKLLKTMLDNLAAKNIPRVANNA